jgi:hypothetical protein
MVRILATRDRPFNLDRSFKHSMLGSATASSESAMVDVYETALVVGAGDGLSASLARLLVREAGMRVGLAARNVEKLAALRGELGESGPAIPCDAAEPEQVVSLFARASEAFGAAPDVVVYNPSARVRGPLIDLDPTGVARALAVTAFGGFPWPRLRRRPCCRAAKVRSCSRGPPPA